MDFLAILPLGFLIGMAHALEADHLVAVTALQNKGGKRRAIVARGAAWGVGHTLSLFAACLGVFLLGLQISAVLEAQLEFCVGLMIVGLGGHVLWRLRKDRIHLHTHEHDGTRHMHFHSHQDDTAENHQHTHKRSFANSKTPVLVGMVHGLAGSAGFLILMSSNAKSLGEALAYLSVFGLGSIIGMAFLTMVISVPIMRLRRLGGMMPNLVSAAVGIGAILVGGMLAVESFSTIAGLG